MMINKVSKLITLLFNNNHIRLDVKKNIIEKATEKKGHG